MPRQVEFGRQWWSRRWLEALERAGWEDRVRRGRSYARAGRVIDLRVEHGRLAARVQGSRRRPYRVEVRVLPLPAAVWNGVTATLSRRAGNLAELLAGRMPETVQDAFAAAGAKLFPEELQAECSCPDWAVPCKHVAAVCYVFGERLDGDPFLIFELRGRGRGAFLAGIERPGPAGGASAGKERERRPETVAPADYWSPGALPPLVGGPVLGLPESLPEPDWWHGRTPLKELLHRVYACVEAAGAAPPPEPEDDAG